MIVNEAGHQKNLGRPDPEPMPRAAELPAKSPIEIAGYRIQRVLGSGGMATVFAAMQSQPRRIVALKVMKPALAADHSRNAHRRFRREIEILGKLHHPYIAQVYGAGVHDEDGPSPLPYFVMEYVSNAKTILEHIAAKDLPLRDRLKLFAKVCAGVDHGHKHKVIHRDLKPSNVLIDEYGEPKIIDFGVALANEIDVESAGEATGLIGTLSYMSPEQVSNKPVDLDARCDVYSLGALLYKVLTGRPAHDFSGKSVVEAARMVREQTPALPSRFKPELRGDLDEIIMKALARLPANRYRNAGSLGRDIVRYLNHQPIHARRAGVIRSMRLFARRHRPAITAGLIAAIVIACGLTIVAFERWRMGRSPISVATTQPAQGEPASTSAGSGGGAVGAPLPSAPLREPYETNMHAGRINAMAMVNAANGPRLASVSVDHRLIVWDLTLRQLVLDLDVMGKPLTQVSLSPDGRTAAVAGGPEPLQIVDLEQGKVARTIRHQSGEVSALAFSGDGTQLAYAGEDYALHVIDVLADESKDVVFRSSSGLLTCLAWSADGGHIIAGSRHGSVYVWSLSDRRLVRQFTEPEGELTTVALASGSELPTTQPVQSQDGGPSHRLFAVSRGGRVYAWKVMGAIDDSNALVVGTDFDARFGGRGSRNANSGASVISAAAFNADASRLYVGVGSEVIVWDTMGSGAKPGAADGGRAAVIGAPIRIEDKVCTAIALEPDEGGCAIGLNNGGIRFVPLQPGE